MAARDQLYELFLQSQEKCSKTCDAFEEHFDWLEEVLINAKKSFAVAVPALLPVTPAKKRTRGKRAAVLLEDEESPPKRPSIESQENTEQVPRRGRAASKIASYKESLRHKLRRPSTPDGKRTTRKAKPTKHVEIRDSVEVAEYVPRENTDICGKDSKKLQKSEDEEITHKSIKPDDNEITHSSVGFETPRQQNGSSRRSSSIGKKLEYNQTSKEEVVCKDEKKAKEIGSEILEDNQHHKEECTEMDIDEGNSGNDGDTNQCRLSNEDSGIEECPEEPTVKNSGIEECSEEPTVKKTGIKESTDTSQSKTCNPSTCTVEEEILILSSPQNNKHGMAVGTTCPVPKPRTTRTKQRVEASAEESKTNTRVSDSQISKLQKTDAKSNTCTGEKEETQDKTDVNAPPEVPKARSTHTKKKSDISVTAELLGTAKSILLSKSQHSDDQRSSDWEDSAPASVQPAFTMPDAPKQRSTRTKKKQDPDSGESDALVSEVPKSRSTRTKQRTAVEVSVSTDEREAELKNTDLSTGKSKEQWNEEPMMSDTCSEDVNTDLLAPPEVPKARSTRTKKKNDDLVTSGPSDDNSESVSLSKTSEFPPPEVPKSRSTRTKKRQDEADVQSDTSVTEVPKSRSTRTKKKTDDTKSEGGKEELNVPSDIEMTEESDVPKSRSTRTKKRHIEEQAVSQPAARTTRTKRRKVGEEDTETDNSQCLSDTHENNSSVLSVKSNSRLESEATACAPVPVENKRMTRSKIRPVPVVKVSPKKGSPYTVKNVRSPLKQDFQRDCCSPKSDHGTPKNMKQGLSRVGSPLRYSPRVYNKSENAGYVKAPFNKGDILAEVEEVPVDDIEVMGSPARVTRHSAGKANKRESSTRRYARKSLNRAKKYALACDTQKYESPNSRWARINPKPRTPSPHCPSDKIIRPKKAYLQNSNSSHGSSGRITPKTYARIRPGMFGSSSTEHSKTLKKMTTPGEGNRTKNIVSSVTSFIKVQAPKPTREELEEKRQQDIMKKREREDEIRKKKEELLKLKVEEQKRRNEERMKRAKEAREENLRKADEAKELLKNERKQREERLKEEQKRKKKEQLLAKKQAEEEVKAKKLREQMEEERRRAEEERLRAEEIRLTEEIRKAEEARRLEEERRAERERIAEEEKRKKRIAEVERITRERKEMEQLKLREAERLEAAKKMKLNGMTMLKATVNLESNSVLNGTFTKTSVEDKENSTKHNGTFICNNPNATFTSDKTPEIKKKIMKPRPYNADDYNINDIKSDDSTDDEGKPKKKVPSWAVGHQLKAALINQEYYPPNINAIFPPEELLTMPDLVQIFPIIRRNFCKRTSSAIWSTPPGKLF